MSVHLVSMSFYRPESNGKIERFNRKLNDILAKKMGYNQCSLDLYLNKELVSVTFNDSETSKFSHSTCCIIEMSFLKIIYWNLVENILGRFITKWRWKNGRRLLPWLEVTLKELMISLFNGISTFVGYLMPKPFYWRTVMVLFNP